MASAERQKVSSPTMIQRVIRFLVVMPSILGATDPFNVLVGDGASYYESFLLAVLPKIVGRDVTLTRETVDACNQPFDFITRGFFSKRPACSELQTDLFISTEPWDSSSVEAPLLMECKTARSILPPSSSSALVYVPFYSLSFSQRLTHSPQNLVRPKADATAMEQPRRLKFCAFMARNCLGERKQMVKLLTAYKPVDVLGSCGSATGKANPNVAGFETLDGKSYLDRAVEIYSEYRFVICIENSRIGGYITEKIVNAFLAGAIPIYLGAPDVEAHFAAGAFINCNGMELDACARIVREVDQNESRYQEMKSHAPLLGNKLGDGFGWHPNFSLDGNEPKIVKVLRQALLGPSDGMLGQQAKAEASVHSILVPDLSLQWWARTATVMDPIDEALRACPTAALFENYQEVISAQCQITFPRRLQGFIACNALSTGTTGRVSASAMVFVQSPSDCADTLKMYRDFGGITLLLALGVECDISSHEAAATIRGIVVQETLAGSVPSSSSPRVYTSDQQGECDEIEATNAATPAVSISEVDMKWLKHEVLQGTDGEDLVHFDAVLKPVITPNVVGALVEASRKARQEISSCSSSRSSSSGASLHCARAAIALSPSSRSAALAAAEHAEHVGDSNQGQRLREHASRLATS